MLKREGSDSGSEDLLLHDSLFSGSTGPEPLNVFQQSNRLPRVEDSDKGCFALCDWRGAGLLKPQ